MPPSVVSAGRVVVAFLEKMAIIPAITMMAIVEARDLGVKKSDIFAVFAVFDYAMMI